MLLFDLTEKEHAGVMERRLQRAREELAKMDEENVELGYDLIKEEVSSSTQRDIALRPAYLVNRRRRD
jgi:hypothetical protein